MNSLLRWTAGGLAVGALVVSLVASPLPRSTPEAQGVSAAALTEFVQATGRQVSNGSQPNSDWNPGYGFQFWRCRHNAYRGDGAFGQYCVVMPDYVTFVSEANVSFGATKQPTLVGRQAAATSAR